MHYTCLCITIVYRLYIFVHHYHIQIKEHLLNKQLSRIIEKGNNDGPITEESEDISAVLNVSSIHSFTKVSKILMGTAPCTRIVEWNFFISNFDPEI